MKKNYGLKIGDRVKQGSRCGIIKKIYKAGNNGLGFLHADVKYDDGESWLVALSNLEKDKS